MLYYRDLIAANVLLKKRKKKIKKEKCKSVYKCIMFVCTVCNVFCIESHKASLSTKCNKHKTTFYSEAYLCCNFILRTGATYLNFDHLYVFYVPFTQLFIAFQRSRTRGITVSRYDGPV